MTEEQSTKHDIEDEPMLYEEPPRMAWQDTAGVIIALFALAIIGMFGYIWLTPGMTLSKFLGTDEQTVSTQSIAHEHSDDLPGMDEQADMASMTESSTSGAGGSVTAEPVAESMPGEGAAFMGEQVAQPEPADAPEPASMPGADPLAGLSLHEDTECPTCGMDGARSMAHVVAQWSDGSHTHHDCFDCLFAWGNEQGLTIVQAKVIAHGTTTQDANWLDAADATYLYGTSRIEMSMPPYVAAFETRAAAEAAQPELGGELMSFAELKAQWK